MNQRQANKVLKGYFAWTDDQGVLHPGYRQTTWWRAMRNRRLRAYRSREQRAGRAA